MIEDKYIVFAHVKDDEYPMCMTIKALRASGKFIPWQVAMFSLDGRILD